MKKRSLMRTIILAGTLLLQLGTLCFHSHAAPGDVDLSFDPSSGVNGGVSAIAVQPDGKVIIGGHFTTVKGLTRRGVARLNADGSGDATFNAGTGIGESVSAVALQSDGKTLVLWNNGHSVTRIDSDGRYDNSFRLYAVGGDYTITSSLAVQPDGKVLVAGYTVTQTIDPEGFIYSSNSPFVTRVYANGSHDTSFNNSGRGAESLVLQPDGKVLIGGGYGILRLNANGSLDSSFNPGANGSVQSIAVQADGKVLIAGQRIGNGTNRLVIARLDANGSLDGSFDPGAALTGAISVKSVVVQSDGKVLIGGEFSTLNGTGRHVIARLNANGSLDNSFYPGTGASGGDGGVYSVALQPDGKVLIGGTFTKLNGVIRKRIARLNVDGSLDGSFHAGSGVAPSVYSLAVQPDGKTLIGGDFSTVQDLDRTGIARLNADGTVDASFNVTLNSGDSEYYSSPTIFSVAVQSDSKLLIGGVFSAVNGTNVQHGIARLNADGSLDNSFNPRVFSPRVSGYVYSVTLQPDGKVLIGGDFAYNYIDGTNYSTSLARLNADGSLDSSFNSGRGVYHVKAIVLQPDGKVLVGGSITVFGRNGITRLNPDGSPDGSFNGGAGVIVFGYVASVALQSNGKVLIGGSFPTVNGTNRNGIARLNTDGSLDGSFTPDIGISFAEYPVVKSMVVQSDAKVLIGGAFSTVNGTNRNGIARLNANGSLDSSFNPGAGVTGGDYPVVNSVAVQSDGNLLIGGEFTAINGVARAHVARLYGDSVAGLNIAASNGFALLSWPVSAAGYRLQETSDLTVPDSWTAVTQPAVTSGDQFLVTVPMTAPRKFFRLKPQ